MTDFNPQWFGGNNDAARFMSDLCFIAHVWDDLIDKDTPVSDDTINSVFMTALVDIPTNPFYVANQRDLSPLVFSGILGYITANRMEKSGDAHQVEIAHGLRYAIANVGAFAVAITNTKEAANEILPIAWKSWMPERFAEYAKEHLNAE